MYSTELSEVVSNKPLRYISLVEKPSKTEAKEGSKPQLHFLIKSFAAQTNSNI